MMKSKFKKQVLTIFLSLLLVGIMPTTVFAASAPQGMWTDYAAADFAGGTGTKGDPYLIATAEQLAKLAKDVNGGKPTPMDDYPYIGKYFKLTDNIDLSAHKWTPIGEYTWFMDGTSTNNLFSSSFDGANHTIRGMYIDMDAPTTAVGLFGNVVYAYPGKQQEVEIKNLKIENATVYAEENGLNELHSGILAGTASANPSLQMKFENILVSGTVVNKATDGSGSSGGLIGSATRCSFRDCEARNVTVEGFSNSGGFVGMAVGKSNYKNCKASGKVTGSWTLGGFVGYALNDGTSSTTEVSTFETCKADTAVTGNDWRLGGFSGYQEYGLIQNCVADGDVTSTLTGGEPKVGGFSGEIETDAVISNSHAGGKVVVSHPTERAGGFIGTGTGTVTDCSFDQTKNPDLKVVGGDVPVDLDGAKGVSTEEVKSNVCVDYYGGHKAVKTAAKAATCTEDGNIEYWYCDVCGRYFSDAALTTEVAKEKTVVKATGHGETELKGVKEATFTAEGYTGDKVCKVCGEVVEKGKVIPKLADNDKDGTCTTGGEADSNYASDGSGNNSESPRTSDDSNIALWLVVMLAAGATMGGAAFYGRKRKYDR